MSGSTGIFGLIDEGIAAGTIRSGTSAYARMLDEYRTARTRDPSGAQARLEDALIDQTVRHYRATYGGATEVVLFHDVGSHYTLFDIATSRTLLVFGFSVTSGVKRDDSYHAGYPSAGDGYDKGHMWAHAQGGAEGGPNYVRQASALNRGHSAQGKIWRGIERYLASNAGLFAFVRVIYTRGDDGDTPGWFEYGLLEASQFRIARFRNAD